MRDMQGSDIFLGMDMEGVQSCEGNGGRIVLEDRVKAR